MANQIEERDGIKFIGRSPKWIRALVVKLYDLLQINDYRVEVRYTDLKTANRIMRQNGYGAMDDTNPAGCIIDDVYLHAIVLIIKPLKRCPRAYAIVTHEMIHIYLFARNRSRFTREFIEHYVDSKHHDKAYQIALKIEEGLSESFTRVLANLGLYASLDAF